MDNLKIKVCGMRDAGNIRAVASLGVDMLGFVFCPGSPRYVSMVSSDAGMMPDYAGDNVNGLGQKVGRVGVFADDMPQNIVTRVYNYGLDYIQLNGGESAVMIDNLRHTLDPDIKKGIKIIKTISVDDAADVMKWREYDGVADMLLFDIKCRRAGGSDMQQDWNVLNVYDGTMPFILSGGIGPGDVRRIVSFSHPMLAGIDVNSRFEISPAMKDVELLRRFIEAVKDRKL